MSRQIRNFITAYVFLVGLPVAGLIGILKIGGELAAPLSVEGVWVETDLNRVTQLPCSTSKVSLAISQSGKNLVLQLNGSPQTIAGKIEGNEIQFFSPLGSEWAKESDCKDILPFTLTAHVDRETKPRTLVGTFLRVGCPSCAPFEFRAARQDPATKGTE